MALEQEASRFRHLDEEWNHTLEEVHAINGFHDFLAPTSFNTLQQAASNGPVVMLTASKYGCYGLVVTQESLVHIPFPAVTIEVVKTWGDLLRLALLDKGARTSNSDSLDAIHSLLLRLCSQPCYATCVPDIGPMPRDRFQFILSEIWNLIVRPVIRALRLEVKH